MRPQGSEEAIGSKVVRTSVQLLARTVAASPEDAPSLGRNAVKTNGPTEVHAAGGSSWYRALHAFGARRMSRPPREYLRFASYFSRTVNDFQSLEFTNGQISSSYERYKLYSECFR